MSETEAKATSNWILLNSRHMQRDLLSQRAGESFFGKPGRMFSDLVAVQRMLIQLVDRTRNGAYFEVLKVVTRPALRDRLQISTPLQRKSRLSEACGLKWS